MPVDYYPNNLAAKAAWHTAFSAQATATGAANGLLVGQVGQAVLDNTIVGIINDYDEQIRGYLEAWTQWRNIVLTGDPDAAFPSPPTLPTLTIPEEQFLPGVEKRSRGYANILKAHEGYTTAIGEDYGIVGTGAPDPLVPAVTANALAGTSNIELKIKKSGHSLVAIDVQIAGGTWTELQRTDQTTHVDETAPASPGQPEQRAYRVQGVVSGARVGDLSPVVTVVTNP